MNKNFFKPKFRIRRSFVGHEIDKTQEFGYLVEVKYWWFPIWVTANINVINSGKLETSFANFMTEEQAHDYISRRYVIYSFNDMPKLVDRHE